jgi:hypothetical protein
LLDAPRPVFELPSFLVLQVTRGAARLDCIPTQRVGTRKSWSLVQGQIFYSPQRHEEIKLRALRAFVVNFYAGSQALASRDKTGSWSFQDCIPKLELGNERTLQFFVLFVFFVDKNTN